MANKCHQSNPLASPRIIQAQIKYEYPLVCFQNKYYYNSKSKWDPQGGIPKVGSPKWDPQKLQLILITNTMCFHYQSHQIPLSSTNSAWGIRENEWGIRENDGGSGRGIRERTYQSARSAAQRRLLPTLPICGMRMLLRGTHTAGRKHRSPRSPNFTWKRPKEIHYPRSNN